MRLAQAAMAHRDTSVSELCRELGIRPVALYPKGQSREQGRGRSWVPEPEDRDAGRAQRRISPPPANDPDLGRRPRSRRWGGPT